MSTKKKRPEADPSKEIKSGEDAGSAGSTAKDVPRAPKKDSPKNPAPQPKSKSAGAKSSAKPEPKAAGKEKKKDKDEDSGLGESVKDIRQFLKEVYIEFNKITWPDRRQVIRETYSVLFLVTVITIMVLAFDWFLGSAIFGPLEHWARLHGGGVGRG